MAGGVLKGSGTMIDPFLIEDVLDLEAVYNNHRSGFKYYKQIKDIDCSSSSFFDDKQHVIGAGYYNGGGYVIHNLHLKRTSSSTSGSSNFSMGFATAQWDNVEVTNLGFENCSVTAKYQSYWSNSSGVGMIGGRAQSDYYIRITNCYAKNCIVNAFVPSLRDSEYNHGVGGIVGNLGSNSRSLIENCYFEGEVHYIRYGGGIVGTKPSANNLVKNCVSLVRVMKKNSSSGVYEGGGGTVYGYASDDLSIENCYDCSDTIFVIGAVD